MKKRITSFLLALMMVLPLTAMTACGNSNEKDATDVSNEEDRTYITLDLWLPCYEGTTEESVEMVKAALNSISEEKYCTHLELHLIPSDEYETAIQNRMAEVKLAKDMAAEAPQTKPETTKNNEPAATEKAATETDEYGVPVIVYPAVADTQMDIFLVRGYDNYSTLATKGELTPLDGYLTEGDPKLLKMYIYPYFLSYSKIDGTTYAIPNNRALGDYTFLLINKDCVKRVNDTGVNIDPEKITSPKAGLPFLNAVASVCPDIIPVYKQFDYYGLKFWGEDGDQSFSLIASQLTRAATESTQVDPKNAFLCKNFTDTYYMRKLVAEKGWAGDGTAEKGSFAMAMVKGGAEIYTEYGEEYYVQVLEPPTATVEEICEYSLGVSQYTKNPSRALEIITLINTNPTVRTILQYGVEGVHWKYSDETKATITKLSDAYNMNLSETGNTYLTFPDYGVSKEAWEDSKKQNLESRTSPYMNFTVTIPSIIATSAKKLEDAKAALIAQDEEIASLQKAIADFNHSTGTDDELKTLQESLTSATSARASKERTLADTQIACDAAVALRADSATIWNRIEALTAAEFEAQLDDLTLAAKAFVSTSYLLSNEQYTDYTLTADTRAEKDKKYFVLNGSTYESVLLKTGDVLTPDTYYEAVNHATTYALLFQYTNYWTDNFGTLQ